MKAVSLVKFKTSKKPRNSKHVVSRKFHFLKRFRERVGWNLSESAYDDLCDEIRLRGRFLYKSEDKEIGSAYSVRFRGMTLKVVYDALTNSPITVLPPPENYCLK
jgi:hypothetical protein